MTLCWARGQAFDHMVYPFTSGSGVFQHAIPVDTPCQHGMVERPGHVSNNNIIAVLYEATVIGAGTTQWRVTQGVIR